MKWLKSETDPSEPNKAFCDCGEGYDGEYCENSKCLQNPCLNNGKCQNSEDYPFQTKVIYNSSITKS